LKENFKCLDVRMYNVGPPQEPKSWAETWPWVWVGKKSYDYRTTFF